MALSMHELIKKRRGELNMSQTAFAATLGTTVTTVSRLESGKQMPGGPLTVRLAMNGVSLSELNEAFTLNIL